MMEVACMVRYLEQIRFRLLVAIYYLLSVSSSRRAPTPQKPERNQGKDAHIHPRAAARNQNVTRARMLTFIPETTRTW